MKTKQHISLYELYAQIDKDYSEWLEMGYPLADLALSLLRKEKEKNEYLQNRIEYFERKFNS